jgi:hypothetical protein
MTMTKLITQHETLRGRFQRLRDLTAAHDEAARMQRLLAEQIDEVRRDIREAMEADGVRSLTDGGTGLSARLETRTAWVVADHDALWEAVTGDPQLRAELLEPTVNTRRAIEIVKAGRLLPGIERRSTETFAVRTGRTEGAETSGK